MLPNASDRAWFFSELLFQSVAAKKKEKKKKEKRKEKETYIILFFQIF